MLRYIAEIGANPIPRTVEVRTRQARGKRDHREADGQYAVVPSDCGESETHAGRDPAMHRLQGAQ